MYTKLETTKMKSGAVAKQSTDITLNGNYAIPVEGDGNGLIFCVNNENLSGATITVIAADNVFCGGDRELIFSENSKSAMHFEGAPYVQRSGEYKGMILVRGGEEAPDAFFSVMEVL